MPKKLLLADDSVVIQKLVGLSFANEDVELVTTDNGDDAVVQARAQRPDLVLADVVMPGLSGYEVCEAIKQDPELRHTPVLLLTGTFESFDENRAQQAGADGHITKPFEAQALVERVMALFQQSAETSETVTTPSPADPTSLDFFDDNVDDLSSSLPENTADAATRTPPGEPDSLDPGFDFDDSEELPPLDDPELLAEPPDLQFGDAGSGQGNDLTVALMPHEIAGSSAEQSPTVTSLSLDDMEPVDSPASSEDSWPVIPDNEEPHTLDPDRTVLAEGDFTDASTVPTSTAEPSLTTVIMSDGDSSSDEVAFGSSAPVSAEADTIPPTSEPVDIDSQPPLMDIDSPLDPWQDGPFDSAPNSAPSMSHAEAPDVLSDASDTSAGAVEVDPGETMLADDLFSDPAPSDATSAESSWPAAPTSDARTPALDDVFEFGSSATDAVPAAQFDKGDAVAPPSASGYDVSCSDLGDPFATPTAQPSAVAGDDLLLAEPSADGGLDEFSLSDGLHDEAMAAVPSGALAAGSASAELISNSGESSSGEVDTGLDLDSDSRADSGAKGPDITPMMRDRVHETLERVAWEAFADLSETLVKQILERVETIAWEVIPQMAEALVKEEIRRMKGEVDD